MTYDTEELKPIAEQFLHEGRVILGDESTIDLEEIAWWVDRKCGDPTDGAWATMNDHEARSLAFDLTEMLHHVALLRQLMEEEDEDVRQVLMRDAIDAASDRLKLRIAAQEADLEELSKRRHPSRRRLEDD